MAVCVLVLAERDPADQLNQQLRAAETPLTRCQLMEPTSSEKSEKEPTALNVQGDGDTLPLTDIDSVEMLSPKLARDRKSVV